MTEVAVGRGVAIVSEVFSNTFGARLKLRPLTPAPTPQEVGIVRALKGDVTPAGEKFCAQLRLAAKKLSRT
jgi:DNA-binding transcriptional LysR family regulator